MRRLLLLFSLQLIAASALANELTVDRRVVRLNETLTIVVSLENEFADVDRVAVPLRNLQVESGPSVSSEFSWINGVIVRRKVFRFLARPLQIGPALVGPLVIRGQGGRQETLPGIAVEVAADATAGTSDPEVIVQELLATGRDPFFVVAEASRSEASIGEQVVVTWYLYNAATVQEWRISRVPRLTDFWSEELDVRSEQPQRVFLGSAVMQRLPIRRVAVFPLRAGTLKIDSLEVVGELMRRIDRAPFGIGEWSVVDVRFSSAPLELQANPVPAGTAAVGELELRCSPPVQTAGGPVAFDVRLSGNTNLRSVAPPAWSGTVNGEVQIEQGALNVGRRRDSVSMTRHWKYFIFPERAGRLDLPPLTLQSFSPSRGSEQLRCEGVSLMVQPAKAPSSAVPPAVRSRPRAAVRPVLPWVAAAAGAFVLGVIAFRRGRRSLRLRRASGEIASQPSLPEVRAAADGLLERRGADPHAVLAEPSERGDSYRAFRSLLDRLDRQRLLPSDARKEIRARARDLIQSLG